MEDEIKKSQPFDINKLLHQGVTKSALQSKLLPMIDDISYTIDDLSNKHIMDPFTDLYLLGFRLSSRVFLNDEACSDRNGINSLSALFKTFDENLTSFYSLFPYLMTMHKITAIYCLISIGGDFTSIINKLKTALSQNKESTTTNDKNDFLTPLLEQNLTNSNLIGVLLVAIWVSVVNTAGVLAWAMIFIHSNLKWRNICISEITNIVAEKFYNGDKNQIKNLHEDIKRLPYEVFEKLNILDDIINEASRLSIIGSLTRRVLKKGYKVHNYEIPIGSFCVVSSYILHNDPIVYKTPAEFDPSRWTDGSLVREKKSYFLGFGAGRHVCIGQKMARIEIKLALLLMITKWNFQVISISQDNISSMTPLNSNDMKSNTTATNTITSGTTTTTSNDDHMLSNSNSLLARDLTCLTTVYPLNRGLRLKYEPIVV